MKFITGDVVQLKSGGPLMTVRAIDEKCVHLVYFNTEDLIQFVSVYVDMVELAATK